MSPLARSLLARSLLALAAILASATALPPSKPTCFDNCSEKDFGNRGDVDIPLNTQTLPCLRAVVDFGTGVCEHQGLRACGFHIKACNPNPFGPRPIIDVDRVICTDPLEVDVLVTVTEHCCYS